MAKKQLEIDIESACDEYMGGDFPEEVIDVVDVCEHSFVFLHPGMGKHDVYQCSKCKKTMTKMWNDSATTTYKDRV